MPRLSTQIKWVPAHMGVEGNEAADRLAKRAITNNSASPNKLPKPLLTVLPHSRSAAKQAHRSLIKEKTQQLWTQSPRFTRMKHTDSRSPSTDYANLISSLPRKAASIITQLRMGHIPLAKYLFVSESPLPQPAQPVNNALKPSNTSFFTAPLATTPDKLCVSN